MKCKYCDYENKKGAIVCECCGATLATQRSIAFYRKEARKKIRPKKEKRIKPIKEPKKKKEKKERDEKAIKRTRRIMLAVSLSVLLLAIASAAVIMALPTNTSRYGQFFPSDNERAIAVYYPESGQYAFLLSGEMLPDKVTSALSFEYLCSQNGITVFSADAENDDETKYMSFIAVSKYGVKTFDVQKSEDVPSFFLEGDGESFLLTVCSKNRTLCFLYSCCFTTDGSLHLVGTYTGDVRIMDIGEDCNGKRIYSAEDDYYLYDCRTNENTVLIEDCKAESYFTCVGDGVVIKKGRLEDKCDTLYYRQDTNEALLIAGAAKLTLSPDGRTLAYSLESEFVGVAQSYVYADGVHSFVGVFSPERVSNGGTVVYGRSTKGALYVSSAGGEAERIANDVERIVSTKDNTDLFILLSTDDLYLSQDGGSPIKVEGKYSSVYKVSECADSFVGGLLSVTCGSINYLCRFDESYRFIPQRSGSEAEVDQRLSSNTSGDQLIMMKDGNVYRYNEKKDKTLKFIGVSMGDKSFFSSDLRGIYNIGAVLLYSDRRNIDVIGEDMFACNDFNGMMIVRKKNGYTDAFSVTVTPDITDGTDNNANVVLPEETGDNRKEINEYSLYYSVNGSGLRVLKKNVSAHQITQNAVYVYVQREVNEGDEYPIYDLYAGTDPKHVKLVAKGIRKVG